MVLPIQHALLCILSSAPAPPTAVLRLVLRAAARAPSQLVLPTLLRCRPFLRCRQLYSGHRKAPLPASIVWADHTIFLLVGNQKFAQFSQNHKRRNRLTNNRDVNLMRNETKRPNLTDSPRVRIDQEPPSYQVLFIPRSTLTNFRHGARDGQTQGRIKVQDNFSRKPKQV